MTAETEETLDPLPDLDEEDMWIRGQIYVNYKRLLEQTEMRVSELEHYVACARYEHEIIQRVRANAPDPQARQDWEPYESAAHDSIVAAEHEMAEESSNAVYYRAMVAEMERDLGDKAQPYLEILTTLKWIEDDWDEEDLDDLEWDDVDPLDPNAPLPF